MRHPLTNDVRYCLAAACEQSESYISDVFIRDKKLTSLVSPEGTIDLKWKYPSSKFDIWERITRFIVAPDVYMASELSLGTHHNFDVPRPMDDLLVGAAGLNMEMPPTVSPSAPRRLAPDVPVARREPRGFDAEVDGPGTHDTMGHKRKLVFLNEKKFVRQSDSTLQAYSECLGMRMVTDPDRPLWSSLSRQLHKRHIVSVAHDVTRITTAFTSAKSLSRKVDTTQHTGIWSYSGDLQMIRMTKD